MLRDLVYMMADSDLERIPWREHPLEVLDLSVRSYNALRRAGVQVLGQLYDLLTTGLIREVRNAGAKSRQEMREKLNAYLAAIPDLSANVETEYLLSPPSDSPRRHREHGEDKGKPRDLCASVVAKRPAVPTRLREVSSYETDTENSPELFPAIGRRGELWQKVPLKALDLSVRSYNALRRFGIHNIGQLHDLVAAGRLLEVTNIGSKCCAEILDRLNAYLAGIDRSEPVVTEQSSDLLLHSSPNVSQMPSEAPEAISSIPLQKWASVFPPEDGLALWLSVLNKRELQIVEWRYGPQSEFLTLEAAGEKLGLTRERVRQIQKRCLRKLARYSRIVKGAVEALQSEMCSAGSLMTEEEVGQYIARLYPMEEISPITAGRLLLCVFPCFKEVIRGFLWGLSTAPLDLVQKIHREIEHILEYASLPLLAGQVIADLKSTTFYQENQHVLSDAFIAACLRTHPKIKQDAEGRYVFQKWNKKRLGKIVQALCEIGQPAHFTIIAERANLLLPPHQQASAQTVRAYMERRTDIFVGLGRGIYWLRNQKAADEEHPPQSSLALEFDRLVRWQTQLDGRDNNTDPDAHTEVEKIRQLGLRFFDQ